jgi:hypothetical protein
MQINCETIRAYLLHYHLTLGYSYTIISKTNICVGSKHFLLSTPSKRYITALSIIIVRYIIRTWFRHLVSNRYHPYDQENQIFLENGYYNCSIYFNILCYCGIHYHFMVNSFLLLLWCHLCLFPTFQYHR